MIDAAILGADRNVVGGHEPNSPVQTHTVNTSGCAMSIPSSNTRHGAILNRGVREGRCEATAGQVEVCSDRAR